MISFNLQFFGGRGSAGGNKATANPTRKSSVFAIGDAVRSVKKEAEQVAPSGIYTYEGEEYEISYKRSRTTAYFGGDVLPTLQQYVDGQAYGGYVAIQEMPDGTFKYHAIDDNGIIGSSKSMRSAARDAFKLDRGWKKKR